MPGSCLACRHGRPLVTLKLATSLDGRIATASGESRWITGPAARDARPSLRADHDAILVGTGTVLADDPRADLPPARARRSLAGAGRPRPASAHSADRPADRRIRRVPTWLATSRASDPTRRQTIERSGVSLIEVDAAEGGLDLAAVLAALSGRGVTRVLVEGGAGLAAALLRAHLVDRLVWFHAPMLIGGDGIPAVAALGLAALDDAPRFERISTETDGDDVLTTFRARA